MVVAATKKAPTCNTPNALNFCIYQGAVGLNFIPAVKNKVKTVKNSQDTSPSPGQNTHIIFFTFICPILPGPHLTGAALFLLW